MKHDTHHKKMDNQIPAWLYFALHDYSGKFKTNNPLEIGINVIRRLKNHYEERKQIGLGIELVPNNDDCAGIYSRCPCQECCNASMRTLDK